MGIEYEENKTQNSNKFQNESIKNQNESTVESKLALK
jgi:hypothetical protein